MVVPLKFMLKLNPHCCDRRGGDFWEVIKPCWFHPHEWKGLWKRYYFIHLPCEDTSFWPCFKLGDQEAPEFGTAVYISSLLVFMISHDVFASL